MKTFVVMAASLLTSFTVFGQGQVRFANYDYELSSPPDRLVRFKYAGGYNPGPPGAPAVGTNLQVQLYYGASTAAESSLIAVTAAPSMLHASTSSLVGYWFGYTRSLNGFNWGDGYVQLQVRVWDINYGATYEQALTNGHGLVAKSATFLCLLPPTPWDLPSKMYNFQGFYVDEFSGPPPSPPYITSHPQSRTVGTGQDTSFTVSVASAFPVGYLWQFNGNNLAGATSNPLTLTNVQLADAGGYSVIVTNAYGSSTSSVATLTVVVPPTFQEQPRSISVAPGQSASFYVSVSGTGPMSYQWQFQGSNISNATNTTYTVTNAQAVNAGNYRVIVSNGAAIVSSNAVLTVLGSPAIMTQPTNVTLGSGGTAIFAVGAAGSDLGYQWNFNGNNLVGATGSTLVLADVHETNVGVYAVVVSNAYGTVGSSNALLILMDPFISVQPSNQVAALNGSVAFTVVAQGTQPLAYQWRHNGNSIAGATNSTFSIAQIEGKDFGSYSVLVYNSVGALRSVDATLAAAGSSTVYFRNDAVALPSPPDRLVRFAAATTPGNVFGTNNAPAVGTNFLVQLYYGANNASEDQLVPVAKAPGTLRSSTTPSPGVWFPGSSARTLEGLPYGSGPATLQVRVWNSADGPTYEQAKQNNSMAVLGKSQPFVYMVPPSEDSFPLNFYMANFLGFSIGQPVQPAATGKMFTLTAATKGGGTLALDPPGGFYFSNTIVAVTATPAEGWAFLGWLGDAPSPSTSIELNMNRDRSVQALFGTTLKTIAGGNGIVAVRPAASLYPYGTVVELTPIPQPGNSFVSWRNGAEGDSNPLYLSIVEPAPTVSAFFAALPSGQVTLSTWAIGNGAITTVPHSNSYPQGTVVTVTAIPEPGQSFAGWDEDAIGRQNPLTVTLGSDLRISGRFTARPRLSADRPLDGWAETGFRFTLTGEFGARYQIETSSNCLTWSGLGILTNSYGTAQVIDPAASSLAHQFYRAVLAP